MKKGISLIVLVITIIIIIILAGAVILNLNNNNPMDNANRAALMQEETDFRSGTALWMFHVIADTKENPFIAVKAHSATTFITTEGAAATASGSYINIKNDNNTNSLSTSTYVGTDGNAIDAGYYDLDDVMIIPWTVIAETTTTGTGTEATTTTNENAGTLQLNTAESVTGYDQIIAKVGMKPSKAGRNNQYKIAMNQNGNTIFYTDKDTLTNRNNAK